MNAGVPTFLLIVTALVVAFRTWLLAWMWKLPLAHGPGFFLGAAVGPGFYDGPGTQWLRRYRTLILAEYLVEVLALAVVNMSGQWRLVPVCAGGSAVLFISIVAGFALWTRKKFGGAVPAATRLAVPLESRSLRDYLSWRAEGIAAALIVASWVLLATQGTLLDRLRPPVQMTYLVAGCLVAKIGIVRMGFALPSERTEEHHRWVDAQRRLYLRMFDSIGWVFAATLAGYAVQRRWPGVREVPWLFWSIVGLILGVWVLLVISYMYGTVRLAAMGRNLSPAACRPRMVPRAGWLRERSLWWTAAYVAGFFLLPRVLPG